MGGAPKQPVQSTHRKWVENCLETSANVRDDKWTCSVAVGSRRFTQDMKELMSGLVLGRELSESGKSFQLRDTQRSYSALFKAEKDEIGYQNSYFWS
jgi:putative transposase